MPEGTDNITGLDSTLPTDAAPAGEGAAELRQLKTVLKNHFPELDGTIFKDSAGGLPTAADFTNLFLTVAALTGGGTDPGPGGGGQYLPIVGEIKMFYGDYSTLPEGWVMCNGLNGTPDFTGRFPLGGNNYYSPTPNYNGTTFGGALPGDLTTGPAGSHNHTLSIDDHVITKANLPAHDHQMFVNVSNDGALPGESVGAGEAVAKDSGNSSNSNYNMKKSTASSTTDQPTQGRTGTGGLATTPTGLTHTASALSSAPDHTHDISGASLPPWSAVWFIMYVGTGPAA